MASYPSADFITLASNFGKTNANTPKATITATAASRSPIIHRPGHKILTATLWLPTINCAAAAADVEGAIVFICNFAHHSGCSLICCRSTHKTPSQAAAIICGDGARRSTAGHI